MNSNLLVVLTGLAVIASCKKNTSDSQSPARDSALQVIADSIPPAAGSFPAGEELKSMLRSPTLVAMIDCPIDELSSDGNNADLKKPDCLDTMINERRESIIHMDSSVTPVFLPHMLEENEIFEKRYYVEAIVANDTNSLGEDVRVPYELVPYGEEWKFRTSIWLTKKEANELTNQLSKVKLLSGIYAQEAKGGVVWAACRNASDSTKVSDLCRKHKVRIKFARIKYARDDIFDLKNDVISGAEE